MSDSTKRAVDESKRQSARSSRELRNALVEAARRDDQHAIRALIATGAKGTANQLIGAARAGEERVVNALLESGARGTRTQLADAIRSGEHVVADALIKSGARGTIPQVIEAAKLAEGHVVKALIQSGVDLDAALVKASLDNHGDAIATLIKCGANPNAIDRRGCTPLYAASLEGDVEAIAMLIESGANPNATDQHGSTPLYAAAVLNGREHVKVGAINRLIEAGANPNGSGNGFEPILHSALKGIGCKHTPTPIEHIEALLANGADPNAKDHHGETALHRVIVDRLFAHEEKLEATTIVTIIEMLIAAGADVDGKDDHGRTAFERAAYIPHGRHVDPEIITALESGSLQQQQRPAKASGHRNTLDNVDPMHVAVMAADADLVRKMAKLHREPGEHFDADLQDPSTGWGLLHYASAILHDPTVGEAVSYRQAARVVRALLDVGADPNLRDVDGATPLHAAVTAAKPNAEAITVLVAGGADPNARSYDGATPVELADVNGEPSVLAALGLAQEVPNQPNRKGYSRNWKIALWALATAGVIALVAAF